MELFRTRVARIENEASTYLKGVIEKHGYKLNPDYYEFEGKVIEYDTFEDYPYIGMKDGKLVLIDEASTVRQPDVYETIKIASELQIKFS